MAFLLNKAEHTVGDKRCCECWKGFPAKCICGGLVHAQFVKEDWQGELSLVYACDICGDKFRFPGQRPNKKYRFTGKRRINKPR